MLRNKRIQKIALGLMSLVLLSSIVDDAHAATSANAAPQITGNLTYAQIGNDKVAINGVDIVDDSAIVTATVTLESGSGTLEATASGSASYAVNTGILTISGSVSDVNATLDTLVFHPATGATGNASVNIKVEDDGITSGHEEYRLPEINNDHPESIEYGTVSPGWTIPSIPEMRNTPDLMIGTNYGGGYILSDLSRPSDGGGKVQLLIANGSDWPLQRGEAIETVLTGLTIGKTYHFVFQWQEVRIYHPSWNIDYAGGQMIITLDGNSQTFSSTGVSDDWQNVELSLTAQSTQANLRIEVVKKDIRQAIAVDTIAVGTPIIDRTKKYSEAKVEITRNAEQTATPNITPTPRPSAGVVPQTGDHNDPMVLLTILGLSTASMIWLGYLWLRKKSAA